MKLHTHMPLGSEDSENRLPESFQVPGGRWGLPFLTISLLYISDADAAALFMLIA